eukprot:SAG31_NODE_1368_length_8614_cov_12.018203_2_plen_1072_part_00
MEDLDRSRRLVVELDAKLRQVPVVTTKKVGTVSQHGMPTHQGYLRKQNPKGIWQNRWFSLSRCELSYASRQSAAPSGTIALAGCVSVAREVANAFTVDTGHRLYRLMAETEADADEWFELIHKSFKIAGGTDGASPVPCSYVDLFDQDGKDAVFQSIQHRTKAIFLNPPADVRSFLGKCEECLRDLLQVLTDLAETGHYSRSDVSDFYARTNTTLLIDQVSAFVAAKPESNQWNLTDAVALVIWCNEYHTRLIQAGAQTLNPMLTDLSTVAILTEQYLPGREGHAKKRSPKGGKIHVWQTRWFVLQHCNLAYYKSQKEDEPLGVIQLHQVTSLVRKQGANEIKMVASGRKTWLQFESAADLDAWMDVLERSWAAASAVDSSRSSKKKISSRTSLEFDNSTPRVLRSKLSARFIDSFRDCDNNIVATLARSEVMIDELTSTLDDISYCHPPRPEIAQFYAAEYQFHLFNAVRRFLDDSVLEDLDAKHILQLVGWVHSYHDRLVKLGVHVAHDLSTVSTFQQLLEFVPQASGFMQKMIPRAKIKGVKAWQRRYFVLKHCILYYYKQQPQEGAAPQGEIRLDQLRSLTLNGNKRGGLGMKLSVGRRVFYLMVQNLEELNMWVDAIDRSTMRGIVERIDMNAIGANDGLSTSLELTSTAGAAHSKTSEKPIVGEQFSVVFPTRDKPPSAQDVENDLEAAGELVQQLIGLLDSFIFNQAGDETIEKTARDFHEQITVRFQSYMSHCQDFEQGAIHSIMSWLFDYHNELSEIGAPGLNPVLFQLQCVEPMLKIFENRMLSTLIAWCDNLLMLEKKPDTEIVHEEGEGLHTRGPTDLFKMIQQQLSTAHATGVEGFTFRIFKMSESVFAHLQQSLIADLVQDATSQDMSLEYLCAVVNNCSRMIELNTEMAEQAEEWISESLWSELEIENSVEGFVEVIKNAMEVIASKVMADIAPSLDRAFKTEWYKDQLMEVVVATAADFFGDLQFWLEAQFFKKQSMRVLDLLIRRYLQSMLNKKVKLSKQFSDQVKIDMDNLVELGHPEHGFVRQKSVHKLTGVDYDVLELLVAQEPDLREKIT